MCAAFFRKKVHCARAAVQYLAVGGGLAGECCKRVAHERAAVVVELGRMLAQIKRELAGKAQLGVFVAKRIYTDAGNSAAPLGNDSGEGF